MSAGATQPQDAPWRPGNLLCQCAKERSPGVTFPGHHASLYSIGHDPLTGRQAGHGRHAPPLFRPALRRCRARPTARLAATAPARVNRAPGYPGWLSGQTTATGRARCRYRRPCTTLDRSSRPTLIRSLQEHYLRRNSTAPVRAGGPWSPAGSGGSPVPPGIPAGDCNPRNSIRPLAHHARPAPPSRPSVWHMFLLVRLRASSQCATQGAIVVLLHAHAAPYPARRELPYEQL
jgi:hypothetical protein